MSEPIIVQGTIEMDGVLIYVRFDQTAPQELLKLAPRVHLKRTQVPGPQTKGGEKGLFTVVIHESEVVVIGTQLEGREVWSASSQQSPSVPVPDRRDRLSRRAASSENDRRSTSHTPEVSTAPAVVASETAAQDRFIHPYNFVRLPSDDALNEIAQVELFRRAPSATHGLYDSKLKSGYLECELTTLNDWFIPDPRKRHEKEDNTRHKTLGYFTLDNVRDWNDRRAESDDTRPAIPASSLRGMVRSVFEAATFSCFSVFDSSSLDFRIGYGPDYDGANVGNSGRGVAEFLPARIVNVVDKEGTAQVQILDGRYASDDPAVIRMALLDSYSEKVKSGNGPTRDLDSISTAGDGSALVVRIRRAARRHRTGFKYRVVTDPLLLFDGHHPPTDDSDVNAVIGRLASWVSKKPESADEFIVFGFLHRTGPNFGNKHFERFFFRAESTYNNPRHQKYITPVDERFRAFLRDQENIVDCDSRVFQATDDSLAGYANRNGKKITSKTSQRPRVQQPDGRSNSQYAKTPLPSDFVEESPDKVNIRTGDLFYALCEVNDDGKRTVRNLYPVAVPRITHPHTRGELLPEFVYPCGRRHECCQACQANLANMPFGERVLCDRCKVQHENLCPACRVFGWTRDLTQTRGLKALTDRVDNVATHVRFTHAILKKSCNDVEKRRARRVVLPILNSPKPTTTGFYLQPLDNWQQAREARWPPVLKHVSPEGVAVPGYHTPAYQKDEARLRGRKQYRRRRVALPSNVQAGKMNQTVHALPEKLTFTFRVHFDNLTAAELGALIFALNLNVPQNWKHESGMTAADAEFCHALGHGKSLGMGRCCITVATICIDGSDRYSAAKFSGLTARSSGRTLEPSDMQPFLDAWEKLSPKAEAVRTRADLLDMLLTLAPSELIQYPPSEQAGKPYFDWWKSAKSNGVQLPQPVEERTDENHRLPISDENLRAYAEYQRSSKSTTSQ